MTQTRSKVLQFFNAPAFIGYLQRQGTEAFEIELAHSVISHAYQHENKQQGQFIAFVSNLLPSVQPWEVSQYCDSRIITKAQQEELNKHKAR